MTATGEIYLSVIIPARNEEERIGKTLDIVADFLRKQSYASEIIVVSGCSSDRTAEVVREKMSAIPNLLLIEQAENRGKGSAVAEGMLSAKGRIRLFSDADNSTDISHFEKMRPFFDQGFEMVIASRDQKDAIGARQAVPQAFIKRLLGNLGNIFIQIVAVRGFWDTQCGFKAFRDFAAEKIFSQQKIQGWGFDIEVLALAKKLGYRVGVIPANWVNDERSQVRLSSYFQVLRETVNVRLNLMLGKYQI